jgi:hypothetical protein
MEVLKNQGKYKKNGQNGKRGIFKDIGEKP